MSWSLATQGSFVASLLRMTRLPGSPRERRTLAIGITTVGVLVVLSRGVPRIRQWQSDHEMQRGELRARVALVREARSHMAILGDTLRARTTRLAAFDARLLSMPTSSGAAAAVAAEVERLAVGAEVKVNSLEVSTDSALRAGLAQVRVRVSAEGDVNGLGAFLQAIDRAAQPMAVRAMSVSSTDALTGADKIEVLRFSVDIDGLALVATERGR